MSAHSFFRHRSVNFSYSSSGSGTAIIFLHGFLENRNMWDNLGNYLPKHYRKIALDLPGHGESENLGYIHSMEDMADVVKALADHLKLKRYFLAGHSLGGYVALAFIEKYPDNIKGLILQNSTAISDSPVKKADRLRAIKLVKEDHKSFIRKSIPNLFRPKNRRIYQEQIKIIKKEALKTSKQGIIAALEGMRIRPNREVLLHFGPCTVLFVGAENDPVLPWESLQEQMHAAKVKPLITPNGHMGHIEDREIVFEGIKTFLKENT